MKIDEETRKLLQTVVSQYQQEDAAVRQRQLRMAKGLKLFWGGYQNTWYSEVAHDWRIWEGEYESDDSNQSYYNKPVNIFRAYLESIIAALSVMVPPIKCYPDDADNPLDLQTAKAGDKAAKLLYRHNDAPLLWIHGLFIFCTEGMIAARTYKDTNEKYGTYQNKKYEDVTENHRNVSCPQCGYELADEVMNPQITELKDKLEQNEDKFQPNDSDIQVQDYLNEEGTEVCPACMQQIIPIIEEKELVVTRLVGITNEPKTRVCQEAYGLLNVKIPNYARTQKECPYLIYSYEEHYSRAVERYDEIDPVELRKKLKATRGTYDPDYGQYARLSPQYNGEFPENVVTIHQAWLRPESFHVLKDEKDVEKLKKLFPNGAHVSLVNDMFADACNADLDDEWTLTYNPLADFVHYDPLGLLLTSIQELTNDIISLTTQTIEHGIGQSFVDPEVVNMNAYRQLEAIPGGMYEAKPKSGRALSESFFELKTATLSGEVLPFFTQLQSLGQLVSGALPSLFGGAVQGGGTASEYSMSRAQALQRLQNTWKMLTYWWKNQYGKAIPAYLQEVRDDERFVERLKDGSFVNIFIRRAELDGRIGRVELEANENLPITWNQKKDVVMEIIKAGVPEVLAILGAPENLPIIREVIGLDEFFVPDEDVVEAVYDDINRLLNSSPLQSPETGEPSPSVEIDPDYASPGVAFEIVRKWVISEAGRMSKTENPEGYQNVLLYGRQYKMMLQMQAMQQMAQGGGAPPAKPGEDTNAPIKGDNDVPTVQ